MPIYTIDNAKTKIKENCWIAPNAWVIGEVEIHENVSVWFGATIRGDNDKITIGKNTNVQDMCIVHTDPKLPTCIGENCTIGHKAIIHGCNIGDNTLVGMGAIIMNEAVVGKNCVVAAGAVVPEGKIIEDGMLVMGVPAKIKRKLDKKEIEKITKIAQSYKQKIKRYKKGGVDSRGIDPLV